MVLPEPALLTSNVAIGPQKISELAGEPVRRLIFRSYLVASE
jgi:hypothetical protein